MQIVVTAGDYPSENTWEVYGKDGSVLASGAGAGTVAFCASKPSASPTSTPRPSNSFAPTELPHPYDQLTSRLRAAENGDIIDLDSLVYVEEEGLVTFDGRDPIIIGNVSVTLKSSKKATLNGQGANGRILTLGSGGSLTIDGLAIVGGTSNSDDDLDDDMTGRGTGQGGCVAAMYAKSLKIVNTDFRNCTGHWGAVIYTKYTYTSVDKSTFEHLNAASSGGGIYAVWCEVHVTNTIFRDSIALWGAVLYGDDAIWYLGGNYYEDNYEVNGLSEPGQIYSPQKIAHDGSDCDPGTYGNCTQLETVQSCHIGICYDCALGKALDAYGATSVTACASCPEGYYSNKLAATTCEGPCQAGFFVTTDPDDADGFGVTVGGTHCVACPAGRIASEAGSSSCVACEVS